MNDKMEKIRNFVENMFLGLPDTQEVRDAKAHLVEGMSDRYEELLAQGKDPDAAFGIAVGEFGSMEELRRELGNTFAAPAEAAVPQPQPFPDEAARQEYETFRRRYPLAIATGVALCILAMAVWMFLDRWMDGDVPFGMHHVAFLSIVAVAVCIFVYFGLKSQQYEQAFSLEGGQRHGRKRDDNPIHGAIMLGATCIYLFLGFFMDLWHPGWIVFPAGAALCLVAEAVWPGNKE